MEDLRADNVMTFINVRFNMSPCIPIELKYECEVLLYTLIHMLNIYTILLETMSTHNCAGSM